MFKRLTYREQASYMQTASITAPWLFDWSCFWRVFYQVAHVQDKLIIFTSLINIDMWRRF